MSLYLPYDKVPLPPECNPSHPNHIPARPTLPATQLFRWRSLIDLRIRGLVDPKLSFTLDNVLLDTGSVETFLLDHVLAVGVGNVLRHPGWTMKWGGTVYAVQYGTVELEIEDPQRRTLRWKALVGFTAAPLSTRVNGLLGMCGFFEFVDALFVGMDNRAIITPNHNFPGVELDGKGNQVWPTP